MSTTAKPKLEVKRLQVPLRVKQLDLEKRTFEGLAATWDLDLGGDTIEKGAFKETLKEWKSSKRNIPLLDSHNWFSVRDAVGRLIDAKETDEGLWTKWRIVQGNDGDEILHRLLPDEDGGAFIDSMSIGYLPKRWENINDEDEPELFRVLKEIELHEVSLVLFPMNPAARIDNSTVKSEKLVHEFALMVKSFVNRFPEEKRGEVVTEVTAELNKKETPAPKPEPTPTPAPPAPEPPKETPVPTPPAPGQTPSETKDDGEPPDMRLYDQIRLRRLASATTNAQEE